MDKRLKRNLKVTGEPTDTKVKKIELHIQEMKDELHDQWLDNKEQGKIPANTSFSDYLGMCYRTVQGRKAEITQEYIVGKISEPEYTALIEVIAKTQEAIKKINPDSSIITLEKI